MHLQLAIYMHIVTQSTALQKSATDTQQESDQHQTTASNDASEQQSLVTTYTTICFTEL